VISSRRRKSTSTTTRSSGPSARRGPDFSRP
jgi:hypothetical protein